MSDCSGPECNHSSHYYEELVDAETGNVIEFDEETLREGARRLAAKYPNGLGLLEPRYVQYPVGCQQCGRIKFLCWKKGHQIIHSYRSAPDGRPLATT